MDPSSTATAFMIPAPQLQETGIIRMVRAQDTATNGLCPWTQCGKQKQETRLEAGFSVEARSFRLLGGQRLDACGEGALVASGLVAVDDVLVDQRIDHRLRVLEGGGGIGLLAGGERVVDFAQGRTHARAKRDVTGA